MLNKYKLVGFINLFEIVPGFVYPVFENGGEYFFQHGKNNQIEEFEKVRADVCHRILPLQNCSEVIITVTSEPIYAFQRDDMTIMYGTSIYMGCHLKSIKTDDPILLKEMDDFFDEITSGKIVRYSQIKKCYWGTGRRKTSVARVRVYENGTGAIVINGRSIDDYFPLETLKILVNQPLAVTGLVGAVDVFVKVAGGGYTGQAGAIRHGLSRALVSLNSDYRPSLKSAGYMTRDPRRKERKKYGLKAARRAPQFSKR